MKHKILNIIGIISVAIAIIFAANITKKDTDMPYIFNTNALNNAEQNVIDRVKTSREKTEELVLIQNKTYMNFVRPLMDIDVALDDIVSPISHLDSVNNSDETQKIMNAILPILSEYGSDMARHMGVYNAMLSIKESEYGALDFAQKTVIDDAIKSFELSGIALPDAPKARLKEIDARLSKLSNDFSNNIIAANKLNKIKITDETLLGDMPETDRNAARTEDGWEFSLLAPSFTPFMEYVTDRNLREQMYKNSSTRAPENEKIITETLRLRNEKAKILGFKNYADLALQFRDAASPNAALEYLNNIADAVKPVADKEMAELKEFAKSDITPWDNAFYSRLLKKEKHSLDESVTKPYFELNATVDGTFEFISDLMDIKFVERTTDTWHDTARYFDIMQNGNIIAGLYTDLQTRESKSGGAWMNGVRTYHLDAQNNKHKSIVYVVANFAVSTKDSPSLLSLRNYETLFHEMGHAVHGLLSRCDENDLGGTNVYRDVVEFPSQFLESFATNPIVMKKIGRHYKTGNAMPDDLIERIVAADRFNKGMFLARQLEFGLFDLELHNCDVSSPVDVQKALDNVRARVSVINTPEYNKFQNAFSHIFSSGYAAGYYSYMWAQSLAADAYMAFDGNPYNKELMHKYRDTVLALGGSKPMGEIYREFLGRDPDPTSLLKFYGLK